MINNICLVIFAIAVLVILTIIHKNVIILVKRVYELQDFILPNIKGFRKDLSTIYSEIYNIRNECNDINDNIKEEINCVNNVNNTIQSRITTILEHIDIIENQIKALQDTKKSKVVNRKVSTSKCNTKLKTANKGNVDSITKVHQTFINKK